MRAISKRLAITDLVAVRKLLAKEKKKLAAERAWHGWTAAFRVHEDLRCISLEIQISEMQMEMNQLREAAGLNQEVPKFEGLDAAPKVLRLRGGMQNSWDVIAGWRQDLEVHRGLIREGVDLHYSIASILAIAEDAICRFEGTEDALRGSVTEAEKSA